MRIIHATNDTRDLHKSYATEVALLGDAKLALAALTDAVKDRLGGRLLNRSPAEEIATRREAWLAKWQAKLTSAETPITPYRVISEFMRVVDPAGAIVTHDSGSPREQLLPFYRATRPRGYLGWGKSHQLGTGLGLTIGAKVAAPDKFCVNFMGDAAFGMTGLDFETAVRCGVPICTVVLNNSAMAIEIPHMKLSHETLQYARSGRQLRQPRARPRRLERAGRGSVADRRCDPACAAADGGGQGVSARVRHQPGDGVLAARGVMEEAEELERAAEWRMRLVDADPSDATSREAAALLERLAEDVRRLRGSALFVEYMAICNWLGESDGIADFMDMANDYRAGLASIVRPRTARRTCAR